MTSSPTRVGIGLSPDLLRLDRSRLAGLVEQINESPIDHVVVTDHISFRGGRGQDGLAAMHYLAGLGVAKELHTGVLILPLRHPTVVARQLLDLAEIHAPGVVAGVGLGGDDPAEYSMVGMSSSERGARMDDALDLLVALLGEQAPVDADGHYPTSGPGLSRSTGSRVQVLVGGRVEASHARAARADGWLGTFCSPSRFGAAAENIRSLDPSATLGYQPWVGIGPDGRAHADAQIERFYGLDPAPFQRYTPVGDAHDLVEQLSPYVDAGAELFNLFPAGDPEAAVGVIGEVAAALHESG